MNFNASGDIGSIVDQQTHDVFISYSRRDKEFVRQLWQTLTQYDQDVWIDWEDIPPAQDWRQEIYQGIEASNHFLFVISPNSVNSTVCGEELTHAIQYDKRIIPILYQEVNNESIHPELARLNWIFFRETDDFEQGIQTLLTTFTTDIDHIRKHTRLLLRAKEWEIAGYDKSYLLWGTELIKAEEWLTQSQDKHPEPTELHLNYLKACRQAEEERQEVELRLQQMTPQQYRNRQALLNKVRNYWINGVLKTSTQDHPLIPLELEELSFPSPLNSQGKIVTENFSEGVTVTGIFDQLGEGRTLVILGEPGGGKTTTLLELARKLIDRAEQGLDTRVPVIFNLSSWGNERQPIEIWLREELKTKYQIPREIGQAWITQQQLLLLLDGLDEVNPDFRQDCVDALNDFNQEYGPEIAISCRIEDYQKLSRPLDFQKVIYLRSLSLNEIKEYFEQGGDKLAGLKAILETDPSLQELASTPLMLNLMVNTYQGMSASELSLSNYREEGLRNLLDAYIDRMLESKGEQVLYSKTQVKKWLTWLAKTLSKSSQTIFLIERMQKKHLSNKQQRFSYHLSNLLMICLIIYPLIILGYQDNFPLAYKLVYSTIISVIVGTFLLNFPRKITLVETLKWSSHKAIKSFVRSLVYGINAIMIYGVSSGFMNWGLNHYFKLSQLSLIQEIIFGFGWGMIGMLIFSPIYTVIGGLRGPEIQTKSIPNQGIWRSLLNAGISLIIGVIIGTLIGGILFIPSGKLSFGINFGATFGSIFGLFSGGGTPCIQHFSLRLVLHFNGCIPWNYAKFLDYVTERALLRKVGGGYIFIHRLLLEYFNS